MTNLFSLEGKNAWITGASYGIGFNIAKAFAAAGIKNIIFNDIKQELVDKGLAAYKEAGIENVTGYVCDVTDENAVKELVERIHREVGQIDILVNNAGIIKRIPMHEMKRSEFQAVIDVDLVAPYIVSAAAARQHPATNAAKQSAKPPPKTIQKAALPKAEARICSQAGFGRMARIFLSRTSNCARSHLPSATSRESWFTATTLSKLVPLMGMNFERA